jgi:manganese transport protein
MAELAIIATDLAELLGSAIALNLLFDIPIIAGILITVLDVLLILSLQQRGFRLIEAFVVTLITTITICFAFELALANPNWQQALSGLAPTTGLLTDNTMLYLALGILGATVMPHNLYLHSALVQTRAIDNTSMAKREAIRYASMDTVMALSIAFFINASIVVLAASVFHANGKTDIAEIQEAYQLLTPMLGAAFASNLFAIALLASGQNATLTATLAGQVVMEGFLNLRLPPWQRRLVTRGLAIIPAICVTWFFGEHGTASLLVLSQVVLSLQLPFVLVPLWQMTRDRQLMGEFYNPRWVSLVAGLITLLIIGLNVKLLWDFMTG